MDGTKTILSDAQCSRVLEGFLKSKDFTLDSFTIDPFASQTEGMIGEQYFLNTVYKIKNENIPKKARFFMKILNGANAVIFEISKSINAFEKEQFVYETVRPLLENSGINMDFLAKSYLCEPYTVVLEDLSFSHYKAYPKNKSLDVNHCKECMKTLARFHAAPLLYEAEKRKHNAGYSFYNQFKDIVADKICGEEETGGTKYMKYSFDALLKLINLVPSTNGTSNMDFSSKLEAVLLEIMSPNDNPIEVKTTLLHGDLWSNNFLFKYNENNQPYDAKLIDFQTINYGPPALDVLQFIFTNTRKDFRDAHQEDLLKFYYKTFSELLYNNNNATTLSEDLIFITEKEFTATCDQQKVPAKIAAMVDRSLTNISGEIFLEAYKSEETLSNFLFEGRRDHVFNSFKIDKSYRELMTEDIIELRDML